MCLQHDLIEHDISYSIDIFTHIIWNKHRHMIAHGRAMVCPLWIIWIEWAARGKHNELTNDSVNSFPSKWKCEVESVPSGPFYYKASTACMDKQPLILWQVSVNITYISWFCYVMSNLFYFFLWKYPRIQMTQWPIVLKYHRNGILWLG